MEINEMYSNCRDSYRPVTIGFVQWQQPSVQLVLKKWIDMVSNLESSAGHQFSIVRSNQGIDFKSR